MLYNSGTFLVDELDHEIDKAVHEHMSKISKLGAKALWRNLAERAAAQEEAKRKRKQKEIKASR